MVEGLVDSRFAPWFNGPILTDLGRATLSVWAHAQGQRQPPSACKPGVTGAHPPRLDARALAILLEDMSLTKTQIAHKLGVRVQSLAPARCPQLDCAMKAHRELNAANRRQVRGHKDKDGSVEAYEDA